VATFTSISGPSLDHVAAWMRDRRHVVPSLRQLLASTYMAAFQVPVLPEVVMRRLPIERVAGRTFVRSEADRTNGIKLDRANILGRVGRPRPPRLTMPVLVLAPVDDPYSRLRTATEAPVPYVDDLTVRHIPGGHWVLTEAPGLVADRVREFIATRQSGTFARRS
jgi:pimeloyl-ACP methyl ester carboxylesterase